MRVFLFTLLWVVPAFALADLRCEYGLVRRGFTPYEVLERCGEAKYAESRLEQRQPGYFVQVEEWIYAPGSNQFQRLLTFENGRLRHIRLIDKPRGYSRDL